MVNQLAAAHRKQGIGVPSFAPELFLATWPILLGLPVLIFGQPTRLVFIAVAILVVVPMVTIALARAHPLTKATPFVWLLLGIMAVSILRAPADVMTVTTKTGALLAPVFVYAISSSAFSHPDPRVRSTRLGWFLIAVPLLLAVSLAIQLGVPAAAPPKPLSQVNLNATLAAVGIIVPRTQALPGIGGSATIGILSGLGLLGLVHIWTSRKPLRLLALALAVPCVAAVVMADTRSVIFILPIWLAAYWLLPTQRLLKLIGATAIFAAFSSLILTGVFAIMTDTGLGSSLGRGTDMGVRLGAGTGRTLVWNGVFNELSHVRPEHFLGYGVFGDLKSGVSSSYAWMLYGFDGVPSYHNTALQYVLDEGYFAAALYFTVIALVARAAANMRAERHQKGIFLVILGYILTSGLTEAAGTVQQFESLMFLFAILGAVNGWSAATMTAPTPASASTNILANRQKNDSASMQVAHQRLS